MSIQRIVCLANSYKHEHRCVAGIDLTTKRWVRLIGNEIPGCLTLREASYEDGQSVAVLDVFQADLTEPCGTCSHPEDVRVESGIFQPVRRFDAPRDSKFLASFVSKQGRVLQGYCDRIFASRVEKSPLTNSLELVRPEDLWWWIRTDGKRKSRALFRSHRTRFDLAVTDPEWLRRLAPLEPGIYPHSSFFSSEPPKTLLTRQHQRGIRALSLQTRRGSHPSVAGLNRSPSSEDDLHLQAGKHYSAQNRQKAWSGSVAKKQL